MLLIEGGRLEEARQAFADAAAIEPLLPQALYNMGWGAGARGAGAAAGLPLGRTRACAERMRVAAANSRWRCPHRPPAPACSVVHLRLQEPEAALPPLRKLHAVVPDNPEAVHCIALAHDMMGDTQARAPRGDWQSITAHALPAACARPAGGAQDACLACACAR